jgi:CubicO group peptidase (beta-lactamase class C family)
MLNTKRFIALACLIGIQLRDVADSTAALYADETIMKGELGARLDDYMQRLANFGFSGAILVAKDQSVVLAKGYGLANREKKLAVTPDTVFSIGSITKQFTAAAILKLELQRKLSVNDPIGKHLAEVPKDKSEITIHHLLTHSAGLESDFGPTDFETVKRGEFIQRALASKLRSKPGEKFFYSNAGYSLLGAIVEIVSGQSYEAYLQEHLFKPAGMTRTGYRVPKWNSDQLAQGYARGGERWGTILERPWAEDGPYWNLRANGGIHSTIGDMYRWHRALDGETVLSKEAKQKLFARHIPEQEGDDSFYGYGWAIQTTRRGTALIAHNGGNGIFAADFRRYVDDGVVVFIASNNAEAPAIRVNQWLDRLIFGGDYPMPPKVTRPGGALLAKYAGTFQLPAGAKMVSTVKDGTLRMTADGAEAMALMVSGKPGAADQLKAVSERTADIAQAQLMKDYKPLHKAFGGRLPLERLQAIETRQRQELESDHGALQSFEVVASVPAQQGVETYVRLKFERGAALICYLWAGERLRGIRRRAELSFPNPLPTSRHSALTHSTMCTFAFSRTTTAR